jgi:glycine cleavage system T protein
MMAKESPLIEIHRHNGAQFREEDGWAMPIHFGEPLQEYEAARSQVGLFDLCHHSLLCFTGADRVSFLHGMVSNDVKALVPGKGIYAAFLDVNGKILADTRVFCTGDSFLVDLWEPLKEKILAHLNRYLIADEVEIADLTAQYGMISLQGSKAELLLKELLRSEKVLSGELDHGTFQSGDAELRVIRSTRTGQEGYDLIIAVKDLASAVSRIQEIGEKFSLRWVGAQAQEILRIEGGIPRYGVDMDETNLLLETGLDESVSFQKGCYLGQEVIERIHSRGHVNKNLTGIALKGDTVAEQGDVVLAEKKDIGKVTSAILSPALQCPIALGYVHRDYLQPGTPVSIQRNGKVIPGEIRALPFYKPPS